MVETEENLKLKDAQERYKKSFDLRTGEVEDENTEYHRITCILNDFERKTFNFLLSYYGLKQRDALSFLLKKFRQLNQQFDGFARLLPPLPEGAHKYRNSKKKKINRLELKEEIPEIK